MLELVESAVFFGIGPILWASGAWVFVHSGLTRRRKISWALVLIASGALIGYVMPFSMIRSKFLLLLTLLPLLAVADVWLARSNRGFAFWFRACSFELCTVFGPAAMFRFILDALEIGSLL